MNYVEIIGKKGYNSLVTKSGNTYQEFHFKLIDSSMNPLVLTGKTVDVIIANDIGTVFRKTASILSEVGTMSIKFEDGEHLDYGNYDLEIHVKHQDGRTDIFPEGSYLQMKVMESLLNRLDNPVNRDILFDIINRAEDAISRVGQAIQTATNAAKDANDAKLGAIDATNKAIVATQQIDAIKEDAITATNEANSARDSANTAAQGANDARENAVEVTDKASLKVVEMEGLIEETIIAKDNTIQATENAIEAIANVGQVIDESHNATIEAITAKEEADLARDQAISSAQDADLATENANLSAQDADLATENANSATDRANTSADSANSATGDARAIIIETTLIKDATLIAKTETENVTDRANEVIDLAVTATNDAKIVIESANIATQHVNDAVERADNATDNANDKAQLASEAAESANVVRDEMLEVLPNVQGLENKKIYSNSIQYVKNNIVHFNGSSYQAVQDTLGNTPNPNDSTYWSILAQRGIDGTGSVTSVNNIHPDLEGNVDLGNIASDWVDITGKPTEFNPTPHTHAELHKHDNKNVIDRLSDDNGQLQYNGQNVGSVTSVNGQIGDIDGLATTNDLEVKATELETSSKIYTDTKVADIVGSAPDTLDTLNELADALGRDPNFATTIATQIGGKVDKVIGKGLSTEDFTSTEKTQLSAIINDWSLVETVQGAKDKADTAELNANTYTDLQIDALDDGIIQQDTTPEGIEEGRLWIDTSDDTFQGTVFEDFNKVKRDFNTHVSDKDIHITSEDRIKLDNVKDSEELIERIRVAEGNSKEYTDEQIQIITENGTSKLVTFDYILEATEIGQKDFVIPLESFDVINDSMMVSQNRTFLSSNDYDISNRTLSLAEGVGTIDTTIFIKIFKNVPKVPEEFINGAIIGQGTIPNNRLAEPVITENTFDDLANKVDDIVDSTSGVISHLDKDTTDAHSISNITNLREELGYLSNGINASVSDTNGLSREVAYLKLQQEAKDRIDGGVTFADAMDGNRFGMTFDEESSQNIVIRDGKMLLNDVETVNHKAVDKVVVNQAYSTAGNGGRKMVRLGNGWLVAGVKTTTGVNFYALKNDSVEWVFLKSLALVGDFSLVNQGVSVHLIIQVSAQDIYAYKFDPTTADPITGGKSVDTGQVATQSLTLAIDPTNGHLHAAWASKNATLPNSFNIRYSKSVDGGVTWSAVEQLTSANASGADLTNPSIVVKSDGHAGIAYIENTPTIKRVRWAYFNGGTWFSNAVIYSGGAYIQFNPSAVVDKEGVIHVTWHGGNADFPRNQIWHSKSTNDVNWTTPERLTSQTTTQYTNPSITVNKKGDLFIIFEGGGGSIVRLKNDGFTWTTDTIMTLAGNMSPSTLSDNTLDFTEPLFIHIGISKVSFYGNWLEHVEVPKTTASAVYNLPSTDYVGTFVQKIGDIDVEAYLNDELMDSDLDDNEYLFDKTLSSKTSTTLRLELKREVTTGDENDAIIRILGGRS